MIVNAYVCVFRNWFDCCSLLC